MNHGTNTHTHIPTIIVGCDRGWKILNIINEKANEHQVVFEPVVFVSISKDSNAELLTSLVLCGFADIPTPR